MNDKMSFDFILKPVGDSCNFACTYCYYLQRDQAPNRHQRRWSFTFTKRVLSDIAEFEHSRGHNTASVTWHGGEPLLLGLDWYKRVFEFQSTLPTKFKNSFQTNGSLLSADWCNFLKENGIPIGISLDGPEHVHDFHRITRKGGGTFQRVLRAIDLCQTFEVNFGVLCVVTKQSVPYVDEILDFFLSHGILNFDFLPAYALSSRIGAYTDEINVPPDLFARFMKRVFDWYLQKDDPSIRIRTICSLIERLLGGEGLVCTMGGACCGSFLTIEVSGDVSFCDDYNAGVFPSLGNISAIQLQEIINSKEFAAARTRAMLRLQKCVDCNVREICGGGCPRHWNEQGSYFCAYYKDLYSYAYERLHSILQSALEEESSQLSNI